jgi:hypothetical protein
VRCAELEATQFHHVGHPRPAPNGHPSRWINQQFFYPSPPEWPQLTSSQLEWRVARVVKGLNRTR